MGGTHNLQKESAPTPEPQVLVEPWMRDLAHEIALHFAPEVDVEELALGIANAYAPERARQDEFRAKIEAHLNKIEPGLEKLQARLEAADRLIDSMKPNAVCPHDEEPDYCVCCETDQARRIGESARAYLEARGKESL